jgi:HlyD family secretion protein
LLQSVEEALNLVAIAVSPEVAGGGVAAVRLGRDVATLFTIAEDLSRMRLQVKVDEADVGELHPGAPATFNVDAYPGQSFPATVTRVDLGANATPVVNSAGTTAATATTVVAYTAELTVANPNELLKPGMTATANITTRSLHNVLLAPNAALRFTPPAAPAKKGIFGGPPEEPKNADVSRGGRQQLWVADWNGTPKAIPVTIGHSDGSLTEVSGPGVRAGLRVITGQLAGAGK